jgi:hypothetical protein
VANDLTTAARDSETISQEIDDLVIRTNLPRIEATAAVLRSHGFRVSDLEATRCLSEEEERRLGADRSLLDDLDRIETARPTQAAS